VVYFWPEQGKDDPEKCSIEYVIEVRYRKILLYEKTLAELKQMGLWEYIAFAPILKDMDEQQLKEALTLLEQYAGKDEKKRNRLLLTLAFYFKRKYKVGRANKVESNRYSLKSTISLAAKDWEDRMPTTKFYSARLTTGYTGCHKFVPIKTDV